MLRKSSDIYNLNEMSHDAAILMIRKIVDSGVEVKKAFIDTVGSPQYYQRKLEREFPSIQFVVESKADANYPPCSAASVGKSHYRPRADFPFPSCLLFAHAKQISMDSFNVIFQRHIYSTSCKSNAG